MQTLDRAPAHAWTPRHRVRRSLGPSRLLRLAVRLALCSSVGYAVTVAVVISLGTLIGFRSLVVVSGSMQPLLRPGDLVVDRMISPGDLRIGDVVTFRDPTNPTALVTHRVRDVQLQGLSYAVTTKGDASNALQRWTIRANGRLGRVLLRIPVVGRPIFWGRSRFGEVGLLVVPALLLAVSLLAQIWRPRPAGGAA